MTTVFVEPDRRRAVLLLAAAGRDRAAPRRACRRPRSPISAGSALADATPVALMGEATAIVRAILDADAARRPATADDGDCASRPDRRRPRPVRRARPGERVAERLHARGRAGGQQRPDRRGRASLVPTFALESKAAPLDQRAGAGAQRARATCIARARPRGQPRRSASRTRASWRRSRNVIGGALDRAATEDELRRRALEDPLTGLANRALLMSQLERELRHAARLGTASACSCSTSTASSSSTTRSGTRSATCCCARSRRGSRACVRDEDLVARLGGDEFVVVAHAHGHRPRDRRGRRSGSSTRSPSRSRSTVTRCS